MQPRQNLSGIASLVGRILLSAIFILSGFAKLGAPGPTQAYIASAGLPLPVVAYGGAVLVELVGGIFLAVGYKGRVTALVLAAFSVVAAVLFHGNLGDQNQFIHFMKNIGLAGGMLYVFAFGSGSLSVDSRLGTGKR
jgi:putative oxidoreductase